MTRYLMKRCLMALLLGISLPAAAASQQWTLSADAWNQPRSASMVMKLPAVHAAVQAWSQAPQQRKLILLHAGGETGSLWADELQGWLVALGVPSDRIESRPGGKAGELELQVE